MPLYFFDVTDTGKTFPDDEGTELADLEEARTEALRTIGEIAKDKLPDGDDREFLICIREENGVPVMTVALTLHVERRDQNSIE
jgi:hypothetical protein